MAKWESLDHLRDVRYWVERDFLDYRNARVGFKIDRESGFVTYDERPNLEEHYRKSYRKNVVLNNIVTTNRKLEYHKNFLRPVLDAIYKQPDDSKGNGSTSVLDFGCAFGSTLGWLRSHGWKTRGYELTDGFVNYGRNVMGLDIVQEKAPLAEDVGMHDLVICYHVLEHVPEPLELLEKLMQCLKPTGYLYLSVPVWFGQLDEPSGNTTLDFENLFHIDHIQVFSHNSIRALIDAAGLKIVQEDTTVYGHTFLISRTEGAAPVYGTDDPDEIIQKIVKTKEAIGLLQKDPGAASAIYPDFPDAYVFEAMKIQKDFPAMKAVLDRGLANCSNRFKVISQMGVLHMQWDQDNNKGSAKYGNAVKYAEECFLESLTLKPMNENALFYLGLIEHQYKGNHREAVQYWQKICAINPGRIGEMMQWIGKAGGEDWNGSKEDESKGEAKAQGATGSQKVSVGKKGRA